MIKNTCLTCKDTLLMNTGNSYEPVTRCMCTYICWACKDTGKIMIQDGVSHTESCIWCDKGWTPEIDDKIISELCRPIELEVAPVYLGNQRIGVTAGDISGLKSQLAPHNQDSMPNILDLVKADLEDRTRKGIETYGVPLKPFNGRNALLDTYHEILDAAQYIRQKIFEETGK